jgi:Fe-S-cluster containining protein
MKWLFYNKGLNFQCKRCSYCCRHTPGYVFLSLQDIDRLGEKLKITPDKVREEYCRVIRLGGIKKLSLTEKSNFDCIFWENEGCIVYSARPLQCQSFPFWSSNLFSRSSWDELSKTCPGINTGKLHNKEEIDDWLQKRLEEMSQIVD